MCVSVRERVCVSVCVYIYIGDECIPPGATLSETTVAHVNGGLSAVRTLKFAPKHNHGGYAKTHCFAVHDSCGAACGSDTCPGRVDAVSMCITFMVLDNDNYNNSKN
jgi:hypothetical protein